MSSQYWLMKSEPDVFSFEDLKKAPKKTTQWEGVRNYQARNFMRDQMKKGDTVLYYHSNCPEPGIVGLAEISKEAYPDYFAWDKKSEYYDPKSTEENSRWLMVDVRYKKAFKNPVLLQDMRKMAALKNMQVLKPFNRLSITPVTKKEFDAIVKKGGL